VLKARFENGKRGSPLGGSPSLKGGPKSSWRSASRKAIKKEELLNLRLGGKRSSWVIKAKIKRKGKADTKLRMT